MNWDSKNLSLSFLQLYFSLLASFSGLRELTCPTRNGPVRVVPLSAVVSQPMSRVHTSTRKCRPRYNYASLVAKHTVQGSETHNNCKSKIWCGFTVYQHRLYYFNKTFKSQSDPLWTLIETFWLLWFIQAWFKLFQKWGSYKVQKGIVMHYLGHSKIIKVYHKHFVPRWAKICTKF